MPKRGTGKLELPQEPFKSGFVSLVGRPNVGKSTLLNHLVGEKVAIVSAKPQTTRSVIRGFVTIPERAQIVFVDTPGIHKPRYLLSQQIVEQAMFVLGEVDWHLFLVDATAPPGKGDEFIAKALGEKCKRTFLLLNKTDRVSKQDRDRYLAEYTALGDFADVLMISAKHTQGLDGLKDRLVAKLPAGEPMYPEDEYTDQTTSMISAELIREQVFRLTGEEIPHASSVYIEQFEQRSEELTYIGAVIVVERPNQKAIVIGKNGLKLKEIGTAARTSLQHFLGTKVFLELFVKVIPKWRDEHNRLRQLGYHSQFDKP
ncbi:MAG: GTPase Era [Candidatus Melainabacteria bacterium HGW-Melainabacteria-1]|nr:MAG: GTPase Era [Candidatus Melainabacteria bacterium HGW-Melainabacteria-1]